MRIAWGTSSTMGYLQININGQWGAVCGCSMAFCNPSKQSSLAAVACRQLGLPTGNAVVFFGSSAISLTVGSNVIQPVTPLGAPGPGSSGLIPILASMMQCWGNESRIQDCVFFPGLPTGDTCAASSGEAPWGADLGIMCIPSSPPPPPQPPPSPPSPPSPPPIPPLPPYAGWFVAHVLLDMSTSQQQICYIIMSSLY